MSQESPLGRLHVLPKLSIGKKIDEWQFYSPFGYAVRIVVKVIGRGDNLFLEAVASEVGEPHWKKGGYFEPIRATDVETLRARVLEACIAYDQVANSVTWTDWLEVEIYRPIHDEPTFATGSAELRIRYHVIRKAILENGREVTINFNNCVTNFPKAKAAGETEVKPDTEKSWGWQSRNPNAEFAYLPSTPENIETLDAMVEGLNGLHNRISAFVRASALTGRIEKPLGLLLESK